MVFPRHQQEQGHGHPQRRTSIDASGLATAAAVDAEALWWSDLGGVDCLVDSGEQGSAAFGILRLHAPRPLVWRLDPIKSAHPAAPARSRQEGSTSRPESSAAMIRYASAPRGWVPP